MNSATNSNRRIHRRWIVMFCVGAMTFAALAVGITWSDRLIHIDQSVAESLNRHAKHSPNVVHAMKEITSFGTFRGFSIMALIVVGVLCWFGRPRLALAWLVTVIGGGLWIDGLKSTFERPRPAYNTEFATELSYSFPSGHAASSAIAYGMLAYCLALHWHSHRIRRALLIAAIAIPLVIGFTRIYLGVHFLSDVLAGYALALAWLAICIFTIEWNRSRTPPANTQAGAR